MVSIIWTLNTDIYILLFILYQHSKFQEEKQNDSLRLDQTFVPRCPNPLPWLKLCWRLGIGMLSRERATGIFTKKLEAKTLYGIQAIMV